MNKSTYIFLILAAAIVGIYLALTHNGPARAPEATVVPTAATILDDSGPDQKLILAFGDSLTAGYGLPQSDSYPSQLQSYLDEHGYKYRVINAGLSGDTSAGALRRIDYSLQDNPDIVIVTVGGNDLLRGLPVSDLESNLSEIVQASQENGAQVIIAGLQAPLNLDQQYRDDLVYTYLTVAERYDTALISFFLEGVALDPTLNLPDGIHPTAKGYQIIVEKNILPILMPLLK